MRRTSGGATRWAAGAAAVVGCGLLAVVAVVADPDGVPDDVPAAGRRALPAQTGMQVVVLPHPDDEIEAWSQVTDRPRTYTVYLLVTRGERSTHCRTSPLRLLRLAADGVRVPYPVPLDLPPQECGAARLDAWRAFLTEAAAADPTMATGRLRISSVRLGALPGLPVPFAGRPRPEAVTEVGPRGARVELDLGDGRVTSDAVRWAVRHTLGLVGTTLPRLPVVRIVGSAYYADSALGAPGGDPASPCPVCDPSPLDTQYRHPDHGAVQQALRTTWFGVPAVVVTGPHDPGAATYGTLDPVVYARVLGVDGVHRVGLFQRAYGWLKADPGWPTGERADGRSFMTVEQAFVVTSPASVAAAARRSGASG